MLTRSLYTDPYRWPLREREDAGNRLQKLVSPLNRNNGLPMGLLGPHEGAWVQGPGVRREARLQHFSVRADSVKNTHSSNDCEPKHLTTSCCFFPSKVVKQPFFSCTIGLNIQIFFFAIFYPAKLKKYIMAACFCFFSFYFQIH